MSYIRFGLEMKFVEGRSGSYVILTEDENKKEYIDSYGHDKEGLIEMLCNHWGTKDLIFKEWLVKELAKELGVKLREKPLTLQEQVDDMNKEIKEMKKRAEEWFKEADKEK